VLKKKVQELVKATYNKEVLIQEEKNEELIGGFVITIGDKQIDASVSSQLANLQNALS
jgi:F-type H+-transporting ATPase subunit delta